MTLTNWTVHVGAARGAIGNARTHAEEFTGLATDLRNAVEDAVANSKSSLITAALQDVYDNYLGGVATVAGLTASNVVNEGAKIVQAWVDSDEMMAADARREIAQVPSSEADAT